MLTMSSPLKCEISDYETMYKKHVHDNLLLNDDLKLLDNMKKTKLKELNRDKDAFRRKFLPKLPLSKKRCASSDIHILRKESPRPSPKPSFVVCKDSPCSMNSWNNLTDVLGDGIDVYRSEVLRSSETPLSYRAPKNDDVADGAGNKEDAPPRPHTVNQSKSPHGKRPADIDVAKNNNETLQFRRRSSTMPVNALRPRLSTVDKTTASVALTTIAENKIPIKNTCIVKDTDFVKIVKTPKIDIKVIPPVDESRLTSTDRICENEDDTKENKTKPGIRRAKSFNVKSAIQNETDVSTHDNGFRKRSLTMDSGKQLLKGQLFSGRLLKRRQTISLSDILSQRGGRRTSIMNRIMSLSASLSNMEADDNSSSIESLEGCRYLRIPGQSLHGSREDISLENLSFTDD